MNKKVLVALFVVGFGLCFLCGIYASFAHIYPVKYVEEIKSATKIFNVDIPLVLSVINAESSFNENAISKAGACGLMQLMPQTAEYIANKIHYKDQIDLFNAECNIYLGVAYLSYLFQKFNDFDVVICAYNAGESEVRTWDKDESGQLVIKYSETKKYLTNVKQCLSFYSKKMF